MEFNLGKNRKSKLLSVVTFDTSQKGILHWAISTVVKYGVEDTQNGS